MRETPVIRVSFKPFGFRGVALRWVIVIKKGYHDEDRLISHERIHINQQRSDGYIKYLWSYFTDDRARAQYEFAAFKYGSEYTNSRIHGILINKYNIPPKISKRICNV